MKSTRITINELEENLELYVDRAAAGESFIFELNGKDYLLIPYSTPAFPNRLMSNDGMRD